jgi:hypothetical protein
MSTHPDPDRIGQTLGNHKVLSLIGRGGMGTVYLAEHTVLGRRSAMKILLPHLSSNPDLVARFFVEARATASLRHPAFVDVYDSGTLPDGNAYLTMEHLQGETLGECLLRRQKLPVPEALAIAAAIADGVGHAHRAGILHRDLKPDNIFLVGEVNGPETRIKVLDFGIAKLTNVSSGGGSQTRTGTILGTPLYMAPEQCRGAGKVVLDQRVDIYSLGCILHMMLVGQPPFPFDGFGETVAAHLTSPPPPLRTLDPSIPPALESLVLRMLAKDTSERPASMEAVILELQLLQRAPAPVSAAARSEEDPLTAPGAGRTRKLPIVSGPLPGTAGAADHALDDGRVTGPLSTLSSMASAIEPAPGSGPMAARSRRRFWLGAVVMAGFAGSLWAVLDRPSRAPRSGVFTTRPPAHTGPIPPFSLPPSVSPSTVAVGTSAVDDPEKTRGTRNEAQGIRNEVPATSRVETVVLDSTPSGAKVLDDTTGAVLGTTPLTRTFPAGSPPVRLSLEKPGFRRKPVTIHPDRDRKLTVILPANPIPSASSKSKGKPTTTGTPLYDQSWRKL